MPLFTFTCGHCRNTHEILTHNGEAPACPACDSKEMAKAMSHFAALSGTPDAMPSACDMGNLCCGGGCGVPQN